MNILVSGIGKMGQASAEALLGAGCTLSPYALAGDGEDAVSVGTHKLTPIAPHNHERILAAIPKPFIVVDYSVPATVERNVELFTRLNIPFVMGTTGGDRSKLVSLVENSQTCAVIASNMAPEIVAFQAMVHDFAAERQDRWKEHDHAGIHIRESHQGANVRTGAKGKADPSGTAKAVLEDLAYAGVDRVSLLRFVKAGVADEFFRARINSIRDQDDQRKLGVPEAYLSGHGWHRYWLWDMKGMNAEFIDDLVADMRSLLEDRSIFGPYARKIGSNQEEDITTVTSFDKTVLFRLKHIPGKNIVIDHNVNGRQVYANGTVRAVQFLERNMQKGKAYSMADVIKS